MQASENVDADPISVEMKRFLIGVRALASVSLRFVHLDTIGMRIFVNADAYILPIHVQSIASGMTVYASVFALSLQTALACLAITGIMNVASACAPHSELALMFQKENIGIPVCVISFAKNRHVKEATTGTFPKMNVDVNVCLKHVQKIRFGIQIHAAANVLNKFAPKINTGMLALASADAFGRMTAIVLFTSIGL
jgi:hypothetical protein